MADEKYVPYIKNTDGSLLEVAAVYDEDGNNIIETYAKKEELPGVRLARDSEGYLVLEED